MQSNAAHCFCQQDEDFQDIIDAYFQLRRAYARAMI